jgi:N-acetylmuramoyl-L-alanine amidase
MSTKIAICAGHGKSTKSNIYDPGAIGNGFEEYQIIRDIAKYAYTFLKANYECTTELINYNKELNLNERINYCNNNAFNFVAEVHMNAFTSNTPTGTEAYYSDTMGKKVADAVCKNISSSLSLPQRSNGVDDGGDKATTYFGIVCRTKMPAILIETCYITTPGDVAKVSDQSGREKAGIAIAKGIATGLNLTPKKSSNTADKITSAQKYYVQVGAFDINSKNADNYKKKIVDSGFKNVVIMRNSKLRFIMVGPYMRKEDALLSKESIMDKGFNGIIKLI